MSNFRTRVLYEGLIAQISNSRRNGSVTISASLNVYPMKAIIVKLHIFLIL